MSDASGHTAGQAPGSETPADMAELADLLLSEQTMSRLLDVILNLALSAVAGVDGASVSVIGSDSQNFETTNATSQTIRQVDEKQYEGSAGPCVEAIRTGREVHTSIPNQEWTLFSDAAAQVGVRSVWSLPLAAREQTIGALNLYSMDGGPMEEHAVGAARGLARQASVVLTNAADLMSTQLVNQHLQAALESRDLIGQAKGILMARQAINAEEAFDILRRASQRSGQKLRDVANDIIANLGPPGAQP